MSNRTRVFRQKVSFPDQPHAYMNTHAYALALLYTHGPTLETACIYEHACVCTGPALYTRPNTGDRMRT